eukprot:12890380-Prorocentrum_lima.AAC.1
MLGCDNVDCCAAMFPGVVFMTKFPGVVFMTELGGTNNHCCGVIVPNGMSKEFGILTGLGNAPVDCS